MTVSRTFTMPLPARLINENDRLHWAKRSRLVKEWRTATGWRAIAAAPNSYGAPWERQLPPSIIDVALPVRTRHRRDPHNYIPTVKAIVDGLVDAGWWPDDNSEWVSVTEPTLVVGGDLVCITARARA